MKQKVDIESWVRKEHFQFFNTFDEPYYGVTVNIDCTRAYHAAKANKVSFFLYYLYQALSASQIVDAFRMRIEGDEVFLYDQINAGSTVGRADGTFAFGKFKYYLTLQEFVSEGNKEVERIQNTTGMPREVANDIIRCSSLPWIDFTSLSHARIFSVKDSCPRISFGKMTEDNGILNMPVSIHVNHALVDGIHLGQYIDCFQQLMNEGV